MTIEFLRARLLSERSVSRTARQRADELARRVLELEEQLKIVSLQRLRAEKATADVLAILESHGATDISEAYDSSSDQEATPCGSEVGHSSFKEEETLANGKLSGRSLSWKSGKDSPHSLAKKYIYTSRRRSSFVSSASSSPKHVGKSCRQIRRRETRSASDELHNDTSSLSLKGDEVVECASVPSCSDLGPETLKGGSANHEEHLVEGPVYEDLEKQVTNCHYCRGHGGDKDMKRALEHQAELIGRYEAEERAQRDWEEKFRENNSRTPDSCDLGNHSDVTEERDDSREPAQSFHAKTLDSHKQEANLREAGAGFSNESVTPNGFQPPPQFDMGFLQDQKSSSNIAYKPLVSEFALSMPKSSHEKVHSGTHHNIPVNHSHSGQVSSSNGSSLHNEALRSTNQFALMPHEPSNKLGSVLEELQKAKLSLRQNLNRSQLVESGYVKKTIDPSVPLVRTGDRFEFPVGSAALFRLPTDFQFDSTTRGNFLSSGSQLSLTNYYPGPVTDRFFPSPYTESRSSTFSDQYLSTRTYPYMETRSGLPTRFPVFQTTLESGLTTSSGYSSPDPHLSSNLPSASKYAYPAYSVYQDMTPRVPSSVGLTSREVGLPSTAHFPFHDDQLRPNMYR